MLSKNIKEEKYHQLGKKAENEEDKLTRRMTTLANEFEMLR